MTSQTGECESTEGKWGGICPACGKRLPNPPLLTSWQAARSAERGREAQALARMTDEGRISAFLAQRTA